MGAGGGFVFGCGGFAFFGGGKLRLAGAFFGGARFVGGAGARFLRFGLDEAGFNGFAGIVGFGGFGGADALLRGAGKLHQFVFGGAVAACEVLARLNVVFRLRLLGGGVACAGWFFRLRGCLGNRGGFLGLRGRVHRNGGFFRLRLRFENHNGRGDDGCFFRLPVALGQAG